MRYTLHLTQYRIHLIAIEPPAGTNRAMKTYEDYREMRQNGKETGANGKKIFESVVLVGNTGKGNYFKKGNRIVRQKFSQTYMELDLSLSISNNKKKYKHISDVLLCAAKFADFERIDSDFC